MYSQVAYIPYHFTSSCCSPPSSSPPPSSFLFAFQTSSTIAILRCIGCEWKVLLQLDIPEKAPISCFEFLGIDNFLIVGLKNGVVLIMDTATSKVLKKFQWNVQLTGLEYPQVIFRDPNKIGNFFVLFTSGLMLGFEGKRKEEEGEPEPEPEQSIKRGDRKEERGGLGGGARKGIGGGRGVGGGGGVEGGINRGVEGRDKGKEGWLEEVMKLHLQVDWKKKIFPKWLKRQEGEFRKGGSIIQVDAKFSKVLDNLSGSVFIHPTLPELSFIWGTFFPSPIFLLPPSSVPPPSPTPTLPLMSFSIPLSSLPTYSLLPSSFFLFPSSSISAAVLVKKSFFCQNFDASSVFAFSSFDGKARIFDLDGKRPLGLFKSAAGGLLALDFSQSGRYLCFSGQDDGIVVFDLGRGGEERGGRERGEWGGGEGGGGREEGEKRSIEWWRVEGHLSFISKAICEEFEDGIVRVTAASMDSCISITEFQMGKNELNGSVKNFEKKTNSQRKEEQKGLINEEIRKENEGVKREDEGINKIEKGRKAEEIEKKEREGMRREVQVGGWEKEGGGRRECFWNIKFEEGRGSVIKAENIRKINEEGVGSLMLAGKNLIACCYDGCVSVWEMERK